MDANDAEKRPEAQLEKGQESREPVQRSEGADEERSSRGSAGSGTHGDAGVKASDGHVVGARG